MAMTDPDDIAHSSLEGRLLVSAPYLEGGGFNHSVIFLSRVEEDFVIGHILNQPADLLVSDVARQTGIPDALYSIPLFKGGPVERNQLIFAAFSRVSDKTLRVQFHLPEEQVLEYVNNPQVQLRAYVGHSRWSQSQLRRELNDRAWYVSPMVPELCMEPDFSKIWAMAMRSLSPLHHIMSHAPEQPSLN